MNQKIPIISVDISSLFKILEREISIVVDNVTGKNVAEYINASVIFFITKMPKDKPKWRVMDEMVAYNENMENMRKFNQIYINHIYHFLSMNVPFLFLIDSYYEVINKRQLDLSSDDINLFIKTISEEEWLGAVNNTKPVSNKEFDGFVPEKLRH